MLWLVGLKVLICKGRKRWGSVYILSIRLKSLLPINTGGRASHIKNGQRAIELPQGWCGNAQKWIVHLV